jgi:putative endonuclease
MDFVVYVLRSQLSGRFYVGHTDNLDRRLSEHNRNHTHSLKNRGPWQVFYTETYQTRREATRRERQIKGMKSRRYIESLARASR